MKGQRPALASSAYYAPSPPRGSRVMCQQYMTMQGNARPRLSLGRLCILWALSSSHALVIDEETSSTRWISPSEDDIAGDSEDGHGLQRMVGGLPPTAMIGSGEPLAPYAIVNVTAALEEQKTKRVNFQMGGKILSPEPDMEEDAEAGLAAVEWKPSTADDWRPPKFFTDPGTPISVQHSQGTGNDMTETQRSATLGGGWVKTGDSNQDVNNTLGYFLSPPDMALCVGNGSLIQGTNAVLSFRDTAGNRKGAPLSFFTFLNLTDTKETTIFDPRCIYDAFNKRFYGVVARRTSPGVIPPREADHVGEILLWVSQTNDPTGKWWTYKIDGTGKGTKFSCAPRCFADFPTLGQDRYGVWVTARIMSTSNNYFGTRIWALAKSGLMLGGPPDPRFIDLLQTNTFIMPANTQGTSLDNLADGGTMYFVASNNFSSLALYTATQTSQLTTGGTPVITSIIINSQALMPTPPFKREQSLSYIDMGRQDISGVAYSANKLYCMGTTGFVKDDTTFAGLAWFVIDPLRGAVVQQRIIGITDWNLFNPVITATPSGSMPFVANTAGRFSTGVASIKGVIDGTTGDVSSLVYFVGSPDKFPINVAGDCSNSDLPCFRSGDYSAIVYADDGLVYSASEHSQQIEGLGKVVNSRFWGAAPLLRASEEVWPDLEIGKFDIIPLVSHELLRVKGCMLDRYSGTTIWGGMKVT